MMKKMFRTPKSRVRYLLLGLSMTATIASVPPARADGTPPSGAAKAFTSTDPVVVQARGLYADGHFADAERLIQAAPAGGDADGRTDMLEVIRRRRMEYSLDEVGLLAKVRRALPDATAADVQRWIAAGDVQTRTIDGKVCIFSREPQNLFLFGQEAKRLKADRQPPAAVGGWTLEEHLGRVVAEAERTGKTEVTPVKHRVTFTLTVPAGTKGIKAGSVLKVWLPMVQEYRQQRDVKLLGTTPSYTLLAPTAVDGHPIAGTPQRTVYFEKTVEDPAKDQVFRTEFEYTSYAYYPVLSDEKARPVPADFPSEYLAERPPHIVFTPEVKALAAQIVGTETTPLARARKIFHWVSDNIPWNAEEEYCATPSIVTQALQRRRGDCGVQSITFQTLCRAAGIPTRWQSGWETKPAKSSMHDWCEIYLAPWGWLPCDPSYGVQRASTDPRVRDFYLGHQDSYRMIFSLDYGRDLVPPKKTLRSEPLDFQRGEVELDGRNLYFDEWDYDCLWATDPKGI
jgi:transglutaminase-like putative cysteine protease